MVNIHHNEPMGEVPDEHALKLFQQQWSLYRKFVDNDFGSSRSVYHTLHEILSQRLTEPFSFLDLGCGDARGSVGALRNTMVHRYHGVDLAPPALALAANNLEVLNCEIELEHGDFIEAIHERPEPADAVWIGLSLHHLTTPHKANLMGEIRQMIGPGGLFLTFEPTCIDGEDRAAYLDRYEGVAQDRWTPLTGDEFVALMDHVRSSDYPESMSSWKVLGRQAGFAKCEMLFAGSHDLFRLFCFSG